MTTIIPVLGNITAQDVDAIVDPANTAMRGGGGVDGAIHRAGGPEILRDCIARFPHGLATGDAGWTTAGDLPARWVIHTVGPDHMGHGDRALLGSCYRRALAVADELGARTIAFPLIGSGARGWPRGEAIAVAVDTIATTETRVTEVRLVAHDVATYEDVRATLAQGTPFRILQGVQALHRRGYHRVRIHPAVSPSGMHWRAVVAVSGQEEQARRPDGVIRYTTGNLTEFAGARVDVTAGPDMVADLILAALPMAPTADDPAYVGWFDGLMHLVDSRHALPVAGADYFDDSLGWEIGWGSGLRYPNPPAPPSGIGPREWS